MGSEGAWSNQLVDLIILAAATARFSGFFAYSPAPGAGNLFMSLAAAAGTDPFGNTYPAGLQIGKASDASQVALIPGGGGASEVQFPIPSLSLSNVPNLAGGPVVSTYANLLVSGPAMTGGAQDDWVQVVMYSNDTGGTFARGELRYIDTGGTPHTLMDWGKSDQAVHIPAGGGPFISAETFHDVSGGSGNTARVKKLPWNAILLDVQATWAATGTTTMGSLPDATYYPTQARQFAVASNAAVAQNARVFVPTSGAIQLVVSGGASNGAGGCSVMYPTN